MHFSAASRYYAMGQIRTPEMIGKSVDSTVHLFQEDAFSIITTIT